MVANSSYIIVQLVDPSMVIVASSERLGRWALELHAKPYGTFVRSHALAATIGYIYEVTIEPNTSAQEEDEEDARA